MRIDYSRNLYLIAIQTILFRNAELNDWLTEQTELVFRLFLSVYYFTFDKYFFQPVIFLIT